MIEWVIVLSPIWIPLVIFATVGVGSPRWEPDGDKAVLEALENEKKEGMK
jgi:hypothetical protein